MCVTTKEEKKETADLDVSRFIYDWCKNHGIEPKEKDWLILPIEHVKI